jgi:hypothetical protein
MAFSFLQIATGTNTGNTAVTATLGTAATANNLLVAGVATDANSTATITGWNALTSAGASGGSARSLRLFWKTAAGGETAISSNTINANKVMFVAEYPASMTQNPLDVENSQTTASGTTHTTPTVSAAGAAGGLTIWACMTRDASTWSNGQYNASTTGVANEGGTTVGTACSIRLWDKVSNSTGNNTGSGQSSGTVVGAAAIAVFKLPPAFNGRGFFPMMGSGS